MQKAEELSLVGVVTPICFLELKLALSKMVPGSVLSVLVQDPHIRDNILMTVSRSKDRIIDHKREGSLFRIHIQKG